MEHKLALERALELVEQMAPYCERIDVAGSVRRKKPDVKDIEIVVIPKWGEKPDEGLGLTMVPCNLLHDWAIEQSGIRWIKTGTPHIETWTPKADGKYWRALLDDGIKLDLFLTSADQWGAIFLIRTGPWEFSRKVVTQRHKGGMLPDHCVVHDGMFWSNGEPVATPEEEDVFRLLGMPYVEPEARV